MDDWRLETGFWGKNPVSVFFWGMVQFLDGIGTVLGLDWVELMFYIGGVFYCLFAPGIWAEWSVFYEVEWGVDDDPECDL